MSLVRGTLIWSLAAVVLAAALGYAVAGWRAALGGLSGVAVSDFEILTLGLFSHVLLSQKPGPRVTRLCLLFLLVKLPILVLALTFAMRLGAYGIGFFVGGMALVYSAMVHVAIRGAGKRQRDPFS